MVKYKEWPTQGLRFSQLYFFLHLAFCFWPLQRKCGWYNHSVTAHPRSVREVMFLFCLSVRIGGRGVPCSYQFWHQMSCPVGARPVQFQILPLDVRSCQGVSPVVPDVRSDRGRGYTLLNGVPYLTFGGRGWRGWYTSGGHAGGLSCLL